MASLNDSKMSEESSETAGSNNSGNNSISG